MKTFLGIAILMVGSSLHAQTKGEYKLLATTLTGTMEKELNAAAADGYRLSGTIGGNVKDGEIITVMERLPDGEKGRFRYKLLATERTSTMQRELEEAAANGYEYKGYTARGEVMVILEKDTKATHAKYEYRLLATTRTSTMQKELDEAAAQGFEFVGVIKRGEVITFLRRKIA